MPPSHATERLPSRSQLYRDSVAIECTRNKDQDQICMSCDVVAAGLSTTTVVGG